MNRALYYKSISDIGKYYTTTDSLIVSLFKEDRNVLLKQKESLRIEIEKGGMFKQKATDQLYIGCIDILESKYLSKQIHKKEKRMENDEILAKIQKHDFSDETG